MNLDKILQSPRYMQDTLDSIRRQNSNDAIHAVDIFASLCRLSDGASAWSESSKQIIRAATAGKLPIPCFDF